MRTRYSPARCCCGPEPPNTTIQTVVCTDFSRSVPALPGVRVKVERSGNTYCDDVTDAEGKVSFTLPDKTVAYTLTLYPNGNPRYGETTISWTPPTAGDYVVSPDPATGYHCARVGFPPVANVLYITLSDGTYQVRAFPSNPPTTPFNNTWRSAPTSISSVSPFAAANFGGCDQPGQIQFSVEIVMNNDGTFNLRHGWGEAVCPPFTPPPPTHYQFGGATLVNRCEAAGVVPTWGDTLTLEGEFTQVGGYLPPPLGTEFIISE